MSAASAAEYADSLAEGFGAFLAGEDVDAVALWMDETGADSADGYAPTASDWCRDVLDVRRTYGSAGDLLSVSLLVAFGGPNAWADFDGRGAMFRVSWVSDEVSRYVSCPEFSGEVVELFDYWTVSR